MAFRPFGFAFEVRTPLNLTESKRRVRECKHGIFDPENGPRGLIFGRFVWLWASAWDRSGPMLIGWIRRGGHGCRIIGRAGSDLNGVFYLALTGAMIPFIAVMALMDGHKDLSFYIVLALCLVALIVLLMLSSRDREEGVALVDFLETAIGGSARHEFRQRA